MLRALVLALAVLACAPAPAALRCGKGADHPDAERCVAGLSLAQVADIQQRQRASNWCWAASISMVLRHHGATIPQNEVVRAWFGSTVNDGVPVQAMVDLLSRNWVDARHRTVRLDARLQAQEQRHLGFMDPAVLDSLGSGMPLIIEARRHAMVLVEVTYDRPLAGAVPPAVSYHLHSVTVIDPASTPAIRRLADHELAPNALLLATPAERAGAARPPGGADVALAVASADSGVCR